MRGFTLIELLVVIAIFSIAIGVISSIFVSGISSQRRVLAEQEILNQISYAIEYMGRAIRMAKKDDVSFSGQTKNCLFGDKVNYEAPTESELRFRNYQNQCQRFILLGNQIYEQKNYDTGGPQIPLTSSTLKINSLKFRVSGESQTDNLQPRVTISIEVESRGKKLQFQTTVSQRDIDVQY
jgi:prepilin-type N-terminal cleavage/methylation domain-containing protein